MSDPLENKILLRADSGLWVARNKRSDPPHALGLVVAQASSSANGALVLPVEPTVQDGMLAYVTERELGLSPLGHAGMAEILSGLPSELTFMNLALILKRVIRSRHDSAAHLDLAREIYGDAPVVEALGRFCAQEGHVLFSEQGLTAVMAQALVHCRPDPRHEFTPEEWQGFKRMLLGSAGLLHDDRDLGEYDQTKPEQWLAYMTQNLLFNATANFGSGLGRTWRLFGELAIDESQEWSTPLDFAAVVSATGLTVKQQLALAFGLYSVLGMDNDVIAILPEGWRSVCERVAPGCPPDGVIAHVAATPAEMHAELTSEAARRFDPQLRWASVPFMERPFLRLEDDRILLMSPRGIESWPVTGVYYRLLRAASDLDSSAGAQHLTAFAGELTEVATVEMVQDAYKRAAARHFGFGRVLTAQPLRGGGESTDILVLEGGDVVLIEVSSSRITAQTRLTGSLDALRRDLDKLVVKRVRQLDRTVTALLNDEISGIPSRHVTRVFPLIASVEPLRWTPMLHAYLIREAPGLLRQPGVQHLQFLELDDLEAVMGALGPSPLARLIARKIAEAGIDADFQQWFHDSPLAPRPTRPSISVERMDRLFGEIVTHLGFESGTFDRWKAERGSLSG